LRNLDHLSISLSSLIASKNGNEMSYSAKSILFINISHLIDHYAMLIFATAVLFMASHFGLTYSELLPYATPGFVAFGACSLIAGWLGDKWRRDYMLVIFLFGIGASLILTSLARTPYQLSAALLLVGVFASIYHPVGTAMLVASSRKIGRDVGINGVWGNFGVASSALFTSMLSELFSWRVAFAVPGLLSIVIGAALLAHSLKAGEKSGSFSSRSTAPLVSKSAMRRVVLCLAITLVASSTTFNAITVSMPKLISDKSLQIDENGPYLGLIVSGIYLFGALAQFLIGRLLDRFSLRNVFVPLSLIVVTTFVLGSFLSGPWFLVIAALISMAVFGQVTINDAIVAKYTSDEWRSRAYAARYFVGFSAAGASVGIVSYFYTAGGFNSLLIFLGVLCTLMLVGSVGFPRDKSGFAHTTPDVATGVSAP